MKVEDIGKLARCDTEPQGKEYQESLARYQEELRNAESIRDVFGIVLSDRHERHYTADASQAVRRISENVMAEWKRRNFNPDGTPKVQHEASVDDARS